MLISQSALAYLSAAWRGLRGEQAAASNSPEADLMAFADGWNGAWRLAEAPPAAFSPQPTEDVSAPPEPTGDARPTADADPPPADGESIPAAARRAEAALFRAHLFARQRRHDEAAAAFAAALALHPAIDLTAGSGFWDLDRAAHRAAADAYEAVGRTRDAMTLRARVELRFKPRLVRSA